MAGESPGHGKSVPTKAKAENCSLIANKKLMKCTSAQLLTMRCGRKVRGGFWLRIRKPFATIGNMSPEFGSTITYFPIEDKTLEYMRRGVGLNKCKEVA